MSSRVVALLGRNYTYPTWNRIMEIAGIGAYLVFGALLADQVAVGFAGVWVESEETGLQLATACVFVAVVAILAADFVSGFVHCVADNFGTDTTPIFGVAFIRPFREHHSDPQGITRHDFVETNGNSCVVNLFVLVPTYFLAVYVAGELWWSLVSVFVLAFTFMIALTNQIHKWAHEDHPPRLVVWLQRYNFVLSPVIHQVHHTAPFNKNYCITTGWMNAFAERSGCFAWFVRTFK